MTTRYQLGYETRDSRKTGIPARFATLSREAMVRVFGEEATVLILNEDGLGYRTYRAPNGTFVYLHSTFE